MKLFTFIAEYKGGTYISQYLATSLEEAVCLWIDNVAFLTEKQLKSFKKHINDDDLDTPTKLEGLNNVWCNCYGVLGALLLLNIIETVKEEIIDKILFTFIADYKGGTYISQHKASNLMDALYIWANNLDKHYFTDKAKAKIQEKVRDNFFSPVPIEKVDNVWCSSYVVSRSLLLLNIVVTV